MLEGVDPPQIQVTVEAAGLAITVQPEDQRAREGEEVTFSVEAEGEGISYRWQKGVPGPGADHTFDRDMASEDEFTWTDIVGGDQASYTFTATLDDLFNDVYRCEVTSGGETLVTRMVKVSEVRKKGAKSGAARPEVVVEDYFNIIYANGTSLLIDGTSEISTTVYIDTNDNGKLDSGDQSLKEAGIDGAPENDINLSGEDGYYIVGGSRNGDITVSPKITMNGGSVLGIVGGNRLGGTINGSIDITVNGGYPTAIYGTNCNVTGNINITMNDGTVGGIAGIAASEITTGDIDIAVNGGTVKQFISGGGGNVAVGGNAVIGTDSTMGLGIIIGSYSGIPSMDKFAISPALTGENYSIRVRLPEGYDASTNPTIATNATSTDLAKLNLVGEGAMGVEAYFDSDANEIKVRKRLDPTVGTKNGINYIYANGTPLLIEGTDDTHTTVYIDENGNGVFDGNDRSLATAQISGAPADNSDLSPDRGGYAIVGGSESSDITANPKITVNGGRVIGIIGGNNTGGMVTGSIQITINGGNAGSIYGNNSGVTVSGDISVTVNDGNVLSLIGTTGNVTGSIIVDISGGTVGAIAGNSGQGTSGDIDITVSNATVPTAIGGNHGKITVGGNALIGTDLSLGIMGIIIDTSSDGSGVESFAISPALTGANGSISVSLLSGYDVSTNPIIATGAVSTDLAKIKLVGEGAVGVEAYFDRVANAIRVRAKSDQPAWAVSGNGLTADTAYVIENYENLEAFAANVSGTGEYSGAANDFAGKYIKLADNFPTGGTAESLTTPIGTLDEIFKGHFNGSGRTVTLAIDQPEIDFVGMFVCLEDGTVENMTVTGMVTGKFYAGGVVCSVSENGIVQNCYSTASVTSIYNAAAGGVVADNSGIVQNCYSNGNVANSGSSFIGGVVGNNSGTVQNCYSTGNVTGSGYDSKIGGVVGRNENSGTVQNCYSTGDVTGSSESGGSFIGGVVGENNWNGIVQNCYSTGSVIGSAADDSIGGVVGRNVNYSTVQKCVALAPIVSHADSNTVKAGRVVGYNESGGTLEANKARADMRIGKQDSEKVVTENIGLNQLNGENATVNSTVKLPDVFGTSNGWESDIWSIPDDNLIYGCDLPTLKGLTGDAPKLPIDPSAHFHCVCGGSVTTGDHSNHSDVIWTAWESNNSLPDTAGSYYLTENVDLTSTWTVPVGTVNFCLNGKKVTVSPSRETDICVDIPDRSTLTVCDHGDGNGGMDFNLGNDSVSFGIYGGKGSAFTLYNGSISATKSTSYAINSLCNNGGTFAVYGGAVSAAHNSSGTGKRPAACGISTTDGITTLWGGNFDAEVSNGTSYDSTETGAYGAEVKGSGVLRLAGEPAFTRFNSANQNAMAAISSWGDKLYAQAENILFSGNDVDIKSRYGYGIMVREVDDSNKNKFIVTNPTTGYSRTEIIEGDKIHLALTGPYEVVFDANGGTGHMEKQSFTGYADVKSLTKNVFVKEKCYFDGWNTREDGSGTMSYIDEKEVSGLAYGGQVTLYAQWKDVLPTMDIEAHTIYANGVPILLAAGSPNNQNTVIYIDKGMIGEKDDNDVIFNPGGSMNGTEAGNDLSRYNIYSGSLNEDIAADAKITMTGGYVATIRGGGRGGTITGSTTITMSGGTTGEIIGGNADLNTIDGSIAVTVSGGTVQASLYGCKGTVKVGGKARIGIDSSDGIRIDGNNVYGGVDSFTITSPLTGEDGDGSINVLLPYSYDASTNPIIAYDAEESDLAKIELVGEGAVGVEAHFDSAASAIRVRNIYNVSGTVKASDTGSGIAATLQLKNSSGQDVGSSVTAGADGKYAISGVPAGTYSIEVSYAGYDSKTVNDIVVSNADVTDQEFTLKKTVIFIPVTGIAMTSAATVKVNTDLTLTAEITPEAAASRPISWSVSDANGTGATVSGNIFRASTPGTATVKAVITDGEAVGTPYTKEFSITVTEAGSNTGGNGGGGGGTASGTGSTGITGSTGTPVTTQPETTPAADGGTVTTTTTTNPEAGMTVTTQVTKDAAGNVTGAGAQVQTSASSVTTTETGTTVSVKVDQRTVDASAQAARSQGAPENQLPVEIQLPAEALAGQLNNQDGKSLAVEVEIPASVSGGAATSVTSVNLPKEVIQAAKNAGKDITVTIKDERGNVTSQWTFTGEDLKKSGQTVTDANLAVTVVPVKTLTGGKEPIKAEVAGVTGQAGAEIPGLAIGFGHSGPLPATARVRIPAGNDAGIRPGDAVNFYYYNAVSGRLELQPGSPYTVGQDGYVVLNLDHCSDYVLVPAAQKAPDTAPVAPAAAGQSARIHVIRKGDTLNKLAAAYGCTVEELLALNHIPDVFDLRIGQEIVIPER